MENNFTLPAFAEPITALPDTPKPIRVRTQTPLSSAVR